MELFWDGSDSKQESSIKYFFNEVDIGGSSPAEACERDRIIVSILLSSTSIDPLSIMRNGVPLSLLKSDLLGPPY